jgi:hypothetical protein
MIPDLIFMFPCIMAQYTKMTNKMQLCRIIYYSLAAHGIINYPTQLHLFFFNISGFHIVVLFNLSKEMVYIPSNTTK